MTPLDSIRDAKKGGTSLAIAPKSLAPLGMVEKDKKKIFFKKISTSNL